MINSVLIKGEGVPTLGCRASVSKQLWPLLQYCQATSHQLPPSPDCGTRHQCVVLPCMSPCQVASPLVGGGLSKALGWRSTFAALAVLCFLFALALLLVMRQETHQRFVLLKLARCDPDKAAHITEWNTVMDVPLKFHAPWIPLR